MLYVEKKDISLTYRLLHKFLGDEENETWQLIKDFLKPYVSKRPDEIDDEKIEFDTFFAKISKILPRSEKYLVEYVKMSCLVRNSGKEFSDSILENIEAEVLTSGSKRTKTLGPIDSLEKLDEAVFGILKEYKYLDPMGSRLFSAIFREMHKVTSDQDLIGIARIDPDLTGTDRLDELIKHVSDMIKRKNYSGILQLVKNGQWEFGDYPYEQDRNYTIKQNLDQMILNLVDKSRSSLFSFSSITKPLFGSQAGTKPCDGEQSKNGRGLDGQNYNPYFEGSAP